MRTIIELPDTQIEALKRMGDGAHLSRAELVRRAVEEYLARHQPSPDDAAFGVWRNRKTDGLVYQQEVRTEWDK